MIKKGVSRPIFMFWLPPFAITFPTKKIGTFGYFFSELITHTRVAYSCRCESNLA